MNEETLIEKAAQGMERVNLDEGGLFVVQMKVEVSVEALKRISQPEADKIPVIQQVDLARAKKVCIAEISSPTIEIICT